MEYVERVGQLGVHPYGSNEDRKKVHYAIAALSIALGGALLIPIRSQLLSVADTSEISQSLTLLVIPLLSPMSAYAVLYWAFDKYIWKLPFLRRLGVVKVPNLAGEWNGHLKSSCDNFTKPYDIEVWITQTWTSISIDLRTSTSSSESNVASLVLRGNRPPKLIYTYENNPKGDAVGTMNKHSGTTVLRLECDSRLTGEYYTGRGRKNHGTMELKKV